ncbi:hypothetical protein HALLA_12740 [Halostagnicola larsenii XH-48]|uniref:DUF7344 domain-containing protein n=1 Tax=Halostagnicola larsenii XH-48 TaxID=797299 RepID=W0JLQ8_9EURY|nr:hypothetical protein [Halostagnicola larsenii]AHF99528.1 hypothetical protein HALLA_12740 [Halostagnicola larsenii XH-48]
MGVGGENEFRRRESTETVSPIEADGRLEAVSKDDAFHLLQTSRRRDVVRYLQGRNGPIELRDLAEQVAAWEQGTTIDSLSSSERQRVYISLYQTHLPKLDEHDIVDYDKNRGIIERCQRATQLESYLEVDPLRSNPDPWPRRYGATVILCIILAGITTREFGFSPSTWLTLLVLAAVGAVTVGHWWSKRVDFEQLSARS